MTRIQVFVSYAHHDVHHRRQVHEFCRFLRTQGVDIRLDEFAGPARRDWSLWAIQEILAADFVLVMASKAYRARAEDTQPAGGGDGVANEAAFLRDRLAYDRNTWQRKILPVVLPGGSADEIPLFLSPYASSRYEITSITRVGSDSLLATLEFAMTSDVNSPQ